MLDNLYLTGNCHTTLWGTGGSPPVASCWLHRFLLTSRKTSPHPSLRLGIVQGPRKPVKNYFIKIKVVLPKLGITLCLKHTIRHTINEMLLMYIILCGDQSKREIKTNHRILLRLITVRSLGEKFKFYNNLQLNII